MAYNKRLPDIESEPEAPHLQAAKEGELSIRRCFKCGYLRWPPKRSVRSV